MNFGNFLGDSAEKVAKEQLQKKAVEVAEEAIKKVMGGDEGKEDNPKEDSGFDVGGLIKNVTGDNNDSGGGLANTIGSIFK